jgi:hypothetical protein
MTTELEAVNTMLSCVGEAPINSLLGDLPASIQIAVDLLNDVSRRTQAKGWSFNTEEDYELALNGDSECVLPGDCLSCDLTVEDWSVNLVQRGTRLYDRKNHTYELDAAPRCTIVFFLTWDELPEAARNYIKIKAARIHQDNTVGSESHHRYSQQDEIEAYADIVGANAEAEDATIFDNWDVGSIVSRKRVQTYNF